MDNSLLTIQIAVIGLLLVACLSAFVFRRLNFPYTIGLVIVGLGLGLLGKNVPSIATIADHSLSYDTILFLFLPPLVFESAFTLNVRLLLKNILPVFLLVTVGVLVGTAIVSSLMVWLTPFGWRESLLFGALISATDPVSVIALFKNLGVPERLVVLVEGESLLNDASAIVIFNLILASTGEGAKALAIEGLGGFFSSFIGGILVGVGLAWLMSYLMLAAHRNALIQGTLSAILAFSTFIVAQHALDVSGVIAVVSAGLVTGWITSTRLERESRQFLFDLWEYLSFLTNSLVFLLVGLASAVALQKIEDFGTLGIALGIAIAAVLLSRAAIIFTLVPLVNRSPLVRAISRSEQVVLFWGGLRGAMGLALALSLKNEVQDGQSLITLTLGVVLFTLLVSGTTMSRLLAYLGFDKSPTVNLMEAAEAEICAHQAALEATKLMVNSQHPEQIEAINAQTEQSLSKAQAQMQRVLSDADTDPTQLRQALWLQALSIEQQAYRRINDEGVLSAEAFVKVSASASVRKGDIFLHKLPPAPLYVQPPIARIGAKAARFLGQQLPRQNWRDRADSKHFELFYERDMSIVYVSSIVIEQLQHLSQSCHIDSTVFSECVAYYRTSQKRARDTLVENSQQNLEAARHAERRIARRVAIRGRRQAIATLLNDGVISTTVGQTVREILKESSAE